MRNILKSLLIISAFFIFASCKEKGESVPIAQSEAFARLAGTWSLGTTGGVALDGSDISNNYPGFVLSFTDGGYTTSNAGELFSATGTWKWSDLEAGELVLDENRPITIISLNTSQFVFSFTFSGAGNVSAGMEGTTGDYMITVVK